MIMMFIKRWGLAAGCEDCSLVDCGRSGVKGLKNYGGGGSGRAHGVGSDPGAVFVLLLLLGTEWRKKLAGFMSTRPLLIL